jgi:hypothetical protein
VTTAALVIALAVEAIPGLWAVRAEPSPPVAAMDWIRQHEDPGARVWVGEELAPLGRYLLTRQGFEVMSAELGRDLPEGGFLVTEGAALDGSGAIEFERVEFPARMARDRYRVVRVTDLSRNASFDEGWYPMEWDGETSWVWMAGSSSMTLPRSGEAEVALALEFPAAARWIAVEADGMSPVCFRVEDKRDDLIVPLNSAGRTRLAMSVSSTFVPGAGDDRELGLRLNGMRWRDVASKEPRMVESPVAACADVMISVTSP